MMKIKFIILSPFENDLFEIIRAFNNYIEQSDDEADTLFVFKDEIDTFNTKVSVTINGTEVFFQKFDIPPTPLEHKKFAKRYSKITLYRVLSSLVKVELPYGSLTGVRPTKLYYELMADGNADEVFKNTFDVSDEKLLLVKNIVKNQKGLININENEVDIFINIPFCPSRCAYCTFVSVSMKLLEKYVNPYVECLKNEISILKNIVLENGYKVRAVYFGGGTPTSLPVDTLRDIIKLCDFSASEFTVEAGRPDTVSKQMLDMLANEGVNRISINPQTFHDKTLKTIGRGHTVIDTLNAYELARQYDFSINMDLIAALPEETLDDFKYSLDTAIALRPENITVHTLALKRGSELTVNEFDNKQGETAEQMVNYSVSALKDAKYLPYYMYRQKYVTGNLENSGYMLDGFPCIYNIDIMEENTSILAAGAGAISKRIFNDKNRIERQANIKDVKEYIERFDELLIKKPLFWK
ncbi:MAG: coproporphyrinogen dehydrogenase HemZ [Clostridia bacterium]